MASQALAILAQQHGWLLKPDTETHINRMDIRSESGPNLYTVSQTRKNGIWMCECMGYRGNKRHDAQGRRSCKHLEHVVPVFEAALANPARPRKAPALKRIK